MRKQLLQLAIILIFCTGCVSQVTNEPVERLSDTTNQNRLLRHVVLFAFKDKTTPEQIKATEESFCRMAEQIEEVCDFEWGPDVSGAKRNQGFTHCFLLTFRSEAARDRYLVHPAHNRLRSATRPYINKILVLDYWTKQQRR